MSNRPHSYKKHVSPEAIALGKKLVGEMQTLDQEPSHVCVSLADDVGMAQRIKDRILDACKLTASGCWQWNGSLNSAETPVVRNTSGGHMLVHAVSYALFVGAYPRGQRPTQKCENKQCVNPEHLQLIADAKVVRLSNFEKLTIEDRRRIAADKRDTRSIARQWSIGTSHVHTIKELVHA